MADRIRAKSRCGSGLNAFTLVELLVVIGIIAVLIAILLPALRGARQRANTLMCASNLRQLMTGAALYWTENRGYFPGPNTSGLVLHRGGAYGGTPASPVQDWDFTSPAVGRQLNFPAGATEPVRLLKFQEILMTKLRCPENEFRYFRLFMGSPLPMTIGPGGQQPYITSYMTPALFHLLPIQSVPAGQESRWEVEPYTGTGASRAATEAVALPTSYAPMVTKVGNAARKIYAFEGARYLDATYGPTALDYSTVPDGKGLVGTPQGNFTSRGPTFTGGAGEPYTRDAQDKPTQIYKLVGLRHRNQMNVAFFDGHVETLSDRDVSKLEYFVPKGSRVQNQNGIALNIVNGKVQWKIGMIVP